MAKKIEYSKRDTQNLVDKKERSREKLMGDEWLKLYDQSEKLENLISDVGKGSRAGTIARKKLKAIYKKMDTLPAQQTRNIRQAIKDERLVDTAGQSAPTARSFGTDRGVDYGHGLEFEDDEEKKRPIRRTHEVNLKKGVAKGGYVKKYAKGGGVRKVRT